MPVIPVGERRYRVAVAALLNLVDPDASAKRDPGPNNEQATNPRVVPARVNADLSGATPDPGVVSRTGPVT